MKNEENSTLDLLKTLKKNNLSTLANFVVATIFVPPSFFCALSLTICSPIIVGPEFKADFVDFLCKPTR